MARQNTKSLAPILGYWKEQDMQFRFIMAVVAAGALGFAAGAASAQGFDGAYAGIFGRDNPAAPTPVDIAFGAYAGYNFETGGGMVAGVEGEVEYDSAAVWGSNVVTATVNGRAGYAASDNVLVYGKAGVGAETATGGAVWDIGGGVEMNLGSNYRLRGEVARVDPLAAGLASRTDVKVGIGMGF
ncbi:MAG: hypothetical protein D6801_05125 [Alphaproteobacteria bacterium]|nr:MAG: hypothetical protein D6801_05125 [Alphaproteobacteria bacterium]